MNMKKLILVAGLGITTAAALAPAQAQYYGPNGAAQSVRQLLDGGRDHDPVVLKGQIVSRAIYDDLYNFSDGTGTVLIKIDHKQWPRHLKIDDKTRVEISGKFDREYVGFDKVKVHHLRLAE